MVLGVIGGAPPSVESIQLFARLVPDGLPWMVTAIGRHNFPMMAVTLALGGHIRTGLEDVVYVGPGRVRRVQRPARHAREDAVRGDRQTGRHAGAGARDPRDRLMGGAAIDSRATRRRAICPERDAGRPEAKGPKRSKR